MKLPHRRQFLHLAAGAAALPTLSRIARAQAYPTRTVRIVVPGAAGNTTDILARLIGQWLSERLGQPFNIENRPGVPVAGGEGNSTFLPEMWPVTIYSLQCRSWTRTRLVQGPRLN